MTNEKKSPVRETAGRWLKLLREDSGMRLLSVSALGGFWNLLYALIHLVLAGVFGSWWFFTMGVYYLTVCGMRASALRLDVRRKGAEGKALRWGCALTFAQVVVFAGVVYLSIVEKRNTIRNNIVGIAMALYTFVCVGNAVRNLIGLRKDRSVRKILLRSCSMAYALGSLYGLERMMLVTFGEPDDMFILTMEAATGAGFAAVIALLGVNLLLLCRRQKKKQERQEKTA